jgi:hypothetical protein
LFFRDLLRPASEEEVQRLVQSYTGQEKEHAQQMFANSLRAALTLDEFRDLVLQLGLDGAAVRQTSDRHWTWKATKPLVD